jgi:xanthine dehydrogenase/oxidase
LVFACGRIYLNDEIDAGQTIDIGQIEGAFVQGWGWLSMEELVFGDPSHPWLRPGSMLTKGPGTYKIPAFDDAPLDFRITLLGEAANPFSVHSSKAIGEPPFFLAASAFFAARSAAAAARDGSEVATPASAGSKYLALYAPATSERLRMACADAITASAAQKHGTFQPKGSW